MPFKELKKKEKEQKRNHIIDAAMKLFSIREYDNVSITDIAGQIGVNSATLYYYFKNKEALYFAVVLRDVRILEKMVKKEIQKGNTGLEKLILHGNMNNKFYDKYPDCIRLLYASQSTKFDLDNLNSSEEFKEVTKILEELTLIARDSIQAGIDDGTIRHDVNPLKAAVLVSIIFQGISNMGFMNKELLENNGINRQEFAKDSRDFVINMLGNKDKNSE